MWLWSTTNIAFLFSNLNNFVCFMVSFLVFDYITSVRVMTTAKTTFLWIYLFQRKLFVSRTSTLFIFLTFSFSFLGPNKIFRTKNFIHVILGKKIFQFSYLLWWNRFFIYNIIEHILNFILCVLHLFFF